MNISDRMALRDALRLNVQVLDNQTKLLDALRSASQQLYSHDELGKTADNLIVLVAREVIKTAARIWDQSAKLQGVDVPLVSEGQEARDETLPW